MLTLSTRTPTTHQHVFELQHPHPVVFDFSNLPTHDDGLLITIPPHSDWVSNYHWHYSVEACEDIYLVSGHAYCASGFLMNLGDGTFTGGGPGQILPLVPEMRVMWRRDTRKPVYAGQAVVVSYKFPSLKNYDLYRQICSVNQDAEVYFHLATTPLWLRLTYAVWKLIPFMGEMVTKVLVAWCLWVQLRVIYAKNDYWTYEGRIPYTTPWRYQHPVAENPPWELVEKELKSVITISSWVRKSCYWVGTRLLGMKESYDEYRPADRGEMISDEKQTLIDM